MTAATTIRRFALVAFWFAVPSPFLAAPTFAQVPDREFETEKSVKAGEIVGRVVVIGQRPSIPVEIIPEDQAICAAGILGMPDDNITIDANGGLADVFVILSPVDVMGQADVIDKNTDTDQSEVADHPNPANATSEADSRAWGPTVITFANCRITPHASIVAVGEPLVLVNDDPVGHQALIQTWNNEVNLQLSPGSETRIRLEAADPLPGKIRCGIHRWMDAVILVTDHPWAALTDSRGEFQLREIPAGKWNVQFWHSRAGYLSGSFLVNRRETADKKGTFVVTVAAGEVLDLGDLTVDGARLRESP